MKVLIPIVIGLLVVGCTTPLPQDITSLKASAKNQEIKNIISGTIPRTNRQGTGAFQADD